MRLIDADAALERFLELTELAVGEGAALVKALIFAGLKSRSVTPTVDRWISVADRLPEPNEAVLIAVYDKNGEYEYQAIAVHYSCGDWDSTDDYFNQGDGEVKYWRPLLPEPPKRGEVG